MAEGCFFELLYICNTKNTVYSYNILNYHYEKNYFTIGCACGHDD